MSEASANAAADRRYSASARLRNFTALPNQVLRSTELSGNAKALYAILLDIVVFQRDEPDLAGLGELLGGGEKTARAAVRELEAANLLESRRRGRGMPNAYELLEPQEPPEGPIKNGPEGRSRTAPEAVLSIGSKTCPSGEDTHSLICEAWSAQAPPLIAHSLAYFREPKAHTATKKALRVYPVEVVVAAVQNYATCLGSDDYRWSYRWTLVDFLNRGLDKFVPDADPLGNFRAGGARPTSDADRSVLDDIPDL